jgi:hypothetical protein
MNEISMLLEAELEKKYESHSILHIPDSEEVSPVNMQAKKCLRYTCVRSRQLVLPLKAPSLSPDSNPKFVSDTHSNPARNAYSKLLPALCKCANFIPSSR